MVAQASTEMVVIFFILIKNCKGNKNIFTAKFILSNGKNKTEMIKYNALTM
jgi:hypothetical protein